MCTFHLVSICNELMIRFISALMLTHGKLQRYFCENSLDLEFSMKNFIFCIENILCQQNNVNESIVGMAHELCCSFFVSLFIWNDIFSSDAKIYWIKNVSMDFIFEPSDFIFIYLSLHFYFQIAILISVIQLEIVDWIDYLKSLEVSSTGNPAKSNVNSQMHPTLISR